MFVKKRGARFAGNHASGEVFGPGFQKEGGDKGKGNPQGWKGA
jgi:hypothetical protein